MCGLTSKALDYQNKKCYNMLIKGKFTKWEVDNLWEEGRYVDKI